MLRGRLSLLLLQQCAASQQQLQQCVWTAAACLSTSSSPLAAAAAAATVPPAASDTAAATQAPADNENADAAAPQATAAEAAKVEAAKLKAAKHKAAKLEATKLQAANVAAKAAAAARREKRKQYWAGLQGASFEQLHKDAKQQHELQSVLGEDKLLLLINKASSEEQVQAAVAAVRANHLKRQRIRQAEPHSPQVFSALLKAGQRAGLGHSFSLQLLQQVEQLGLQPSLAMCEEVLSACTKQQDYAAASLTWLYAKAHFMQPGGGKAAGQQREAAAGQQREPWARKNMVRLYAYAVAGWLQEGGVSQKHKQRLQDELQGLAQELTDRGEKVPVAVQQALQAAVAEKESVADGADAGSSGAVDGEGEGDAAEQAAAGDGVKAPSTA